MITTQEAPLQDGRLSNQQDLTDAVDIFLRHLKEDPMYIRSAEHTPAAIAEWFERKELDALWFASMDEARVGVVGLSRHCFSLVPQYPVPNVEICRLMVVPEARQQKIGRTLFHTALAAVKEDTP